jgi:hypothetical protein
MSNRNQVLRLFSTMGLLAMPGFASYLNEPRFLFGREVDFGGLRIR